MIKYLIATAVLMTVLISPSNASTALDIGFSTDRSIDHYIIIFTGPTVGDTRTESGSLSIPVRPGYYSIEIQGVFKNGTRTLIRRYNDTVGLTPT